MNIMYIYSNQNHPFLLHYNRIYNFTWVYVFIHIEYQKLVDPFLIIIINSHYIHGLHYRNLNGYL